jgi:hypothetical protein
MSAYVIFLDKVQDFFQAFLHGDVDCAVEAKYGRQTMIRRRLHWRVRPLIRLAACRSPSGLWLLNDFKHFGPFSKEKRL